MFSVIIPLYNKQDSIIETLQSVLQQTFTEFEVLLVDDGSTDESVARAATIEDERIRIIQKVNGGVSSARNRGIEEAKFRYIAFLDADDIWEKNYLEEQKRLIEDFPDAKMWGCAFGYLIKGEKIAINHKLPELYRGYIDNYFGMKKGSMLFWASAVVIDRLVFDEIEPFDKRMNIGEDWDVWFRIILRYKTVFYNKILTYYKQDAENRACERKILLTERMPFYLEKYDKERAENITFRKWIDGHTASVMRKHYFEERDMRVKRIIEMLDFSQLPFLLTCMYKTPYWIGFIIYRADLLVKKIIQKIK